MLPTLESCSVAVAEPEIPPPSVSGPRPLLLPLVQVWSRFVTSGVVGGVVAVTTDTGPHVEEEVLAGRAAHVAIAVEEPQLRERIARRSLQARRFDKCVTCWCSRCARRWRLYAVSAVTQRERQVQAAAVNGMPKLFTRAFAIINRIEVVTAVEGGRTPAR